MTSLTVSCLKQPFGDGTTCVNTFQCSYIEEKHPRHISTVMERSTPVFVEVSMEGSDNSNVRSVTVPDSSPHSIQDPQRAEVNTAVDELPVTGVDEVAVTGVDEVAKLRNNKERIDMQEI